MTTRTFKNSEVLAAWLDGKVVQYIDGSGTWHDWLNEYPPIVWFSDGWEWRIKPRIRYINIYADREGHYLDGELYESYRDAVEAGEDQFPDYVKTIEVEL